MGPWGIPFELAIIPPSRKENMELNAQNFSSAE